MEHPQVLMYFLMLKIEHNSIANTLKRRSVGYRVEEKKVMKWQFLG